MRIFTLSLLILLAACKKDPDPGDTDTDVIVTPAQALHDAAVGSWRFDDPGLFAIGDDPSPDSLVLREDGSGTVTFRETSTGSLICLDLRWDTTEHSLMFDFEFSEFALYLFDGLWSAELGEDTLTLTPDFGTPTVLERTEGVSEDRQCKEITVEEEVSTDRDLYSDANLVYDPNSESIYVAHPDEARMDPVELGDSSAMLAPWFFSTSNLRSPQFYDAAAGEVWFLQPGFQERLVCRTRADADCGTIDTLFIGHELNLTSATMTDDGMFWVHGTTPAGERELMLIDPSGPNVEDTVSFDFELGQMVWLDDRLYAIAKDMGGPLLEIDPEEGTVERTLGSQDMPQQLVRWEGITVAEGELWIGVRSNLEGDDSLTLKRISLPDAD